MKLNYNLEHIPHEIINVVQKQLKSFVTGAQGRTGIGLKWLEYTYKCFMFLKRQVAVPLDSTVFILQKENENTMSHIGIKPQHGGSGHPWW